MTISEIEARMAAIANEIDSASGDALTALEAEMTSLSEQRSTLLSEVSRRQAIRDQVAQGSGAPVPAAVPAPQEDVEVLEARAFAGFIRGTVNQMRTGEQNFTLTGNGALVPSSIGRRIIEAVTELCPILAGADVYHVKGTLKIPVYGNANSTHNIAVGYGADFTDLTADAGAFTSVDLTGHLVGALTLVGRTLQTNADIDLVAFVIRKMAESVASFVEGELLTGTGASGHCTGALATTNTMNAGSTTAISMDNLIDLQAKVKQPFQAGAVWTMNPATFTAIKKLKDQNGRYLVQDDITGAFPYRLLGKPVYISEHMPTIASAAKAVLYGDYQGLAVNIREDVSVEVLREKYATQHAIGVVAWMELDSKVADAQRLATLVMST